MIPSTTSDHNPPTPPSFSIYLHICKHSFFFLFAPTRADSNRREGSHSPSGPCLSQPFRGEWWQKKEKERRQGKTGAQKASFSKDTILTLCLLVSDKREEKLNKIKFWFCVASMRKAHFLWGCVERVGSPSFLGACNPTSTSPFAERNMQTHFIDFWGPVENTEWISVRDLSQQKPFQNTAAG